MRILIGLCFFCFLSCLPSEEIILPIPGLDSDDVRKSFTFENELTADVAKKIAEAFSKRVFFLDDIENARVTLDIKGVTFDEAYHLLLFPINYRYKEFEEGIVVVGRVCEE